MDIIGGNHFYIVDLSYIIFFSGYSAFTTYKRNFDIRSTSLHPKFDPTLDEEFCEIFQSTLTYTIKKPLQSINPFINLANVIFCTDCARKNIWRREFYPDYKINRDVKDTSKDEFDFGKVFNYAKTIAIPNLCEEFGCIRVSCECAEGDDVIAVLTKKILNDDIKNKVVIISSDRDMLQLYQDRVTIITAQGQERTPPKDIEKLTKVKVDDSFSASDFLLFKILIGDSADNIPNVKTGIGAKKALALVTDRNKLKKLLVEDSIARESFSRNKRLISMNEIPSEVEEMILESYNHELENRGII